MPSRVECFWLEPTLDAAVLYRRYVWSTERDEECTFSSIPYEGHVPTVWGYHNASVTVERRPRGADDAGHHPTENEKADPRWPKTCGCGYVFKDNDSWQVNIHTLYASKTRKGQWTLHDAPAGAMWDAPWHKGYDGKHPKPDDIYLVVRTPAGDWLVDGPSSNGGGAGWARTGVPPLVTASPSIGFGEPMRMHGWLRNGVLEIDMP